MTLIIDAERLYKLSLKHPVYGQPLRIVFSETGDSEIWPGSTRYGSTAYQFRAAGG